MLNNKTLETNIGKLKKNKICLRQLYQIKNGQNETSNTFQNGPNTVQYTSLKKRERARARKRTKGEENKISKAADRNEI